MNKSIIRITAIADKEWIQIIRDSRSLILSLAVPILLILLFGYALTMDVKNVRIGVYDQDRSSLSRQYIEKLSNTEYLSIQQYIRTYDEVNALINAGEIVIAVVIPVNFEKRYMSGENADIQLIIDGSDSTSSTIASGYIRIITYQFNSLLHEEKLHRAGVPEVSSPIDVRSRVWYNSKLESKNFIVPGLVVLILAIIAALITSLTISREWERGTMETLITTPIRSYEVIIGKLIPYLLIGTFDVIIALSIGYFVFDIPLRGSFIELALIAGLFLIGTLSLGILISSATRIQVLSIQLSVLITYLPSFILSDFIFPIKNMPIIIQAVTYLVPARYMIAVIKGIAIKGVSYHLLWAQIIFLLLFSLITVVLSIRKFKLTLPE